MYQNDADVYEEFMYWNSKVKENKKQGKGGKR